MGTYHKLKHVRVRIVLLRERSTVAAEATIGDTRWKALRYVFSAALVDALDVCALFVLERTMALWVSVTLPDTDSGISTYSRVHPILLPSQTFDKHQKTKSGIFIGRRHISFVLRRQLLLHRLFL